MKPGTNEAIVEGILYEKVVRNFDDGAIAGELIIEVPLSVDGAEVKSHIPVSFYSRPITKAGKENVAYKGIKTILDSAVALSESTDGKASFIRLRNGNLGENMFFAQDDRFVSFARIRGNFFDRVKETDFNPKAVFKVKMIVANMYPEEITQGDETFETGRLVVIGHIIQYNGTIDEVKFFVDNQKHVDIISKNWSEGDTVNAQGIIKFITKEVEVASEEEDGFGDPMVTSETRRIREFVITGGSMTPVEGYDEDDIYEARKERKARIAQQKETQAEKNRESKKKTSNDVGF
ncbi:MAG: hypothetical protein PHY75_05505 [Bacteroidales bacterium]|nr:hypothetical protein [Bacteroidales bacterium]